MQPYRAKVFSGLASRVNSSSAEKGNQLSPSQYEIVKAPDVISLSKYPFSKMEIGDAFYVACEKDLRAHKQSEIHASARRFREKHNSSFRITTRATMHEGSYAVVVIRVK